MDPTVNATMFKLLFPKTKRNTILAMCSLVAVLAFGGVCIRQVLNLPPGTRFSWINPGSSASGFVGPIRTVADPDLENAGWRCEYVSRSFAEKQIAFVRVETHTVQVKVVREKAVLDLPSLRFTLLDVKGNQLSSGALIPKPPGDVDSIFEISDAALAQTDCIVVQRASK
jgi:hypothetical protein